MKVLLLHGSAKAVSRKKLLDLKEKFEPNNVVVFEESNSKEIADNLMASSLFSDERLVILENPPEDFIPDLSPITYHLSLILWFDHEVSEKKSVMSWFKENKGEILFFPEAKEITIFPFLDMLANGDKGAFLELRKLKDRGFDIQYFITMVFYLLRNLAVTPKTAPQFVKDKLIRQRKNFSKVKITYLYKEILEIDFKIKSGLLDINHAEFSLVNLFCH